MGTENLDTRGGGNDLFRRYVDMGDKVVGAYLATAALGSVFVVKIIGGKSPEMVDKMLNFSAQMAKKLGFDGVSRQDILSAQPGVDTALALSTFAGAFIYYHLSKKHSILEQQIDSMQGIK